MKFIAHVRSTPNDFVAELHITETLYKEDDDGYLQIEGETINHCIVIEGHNAYKRALALANQIRKSSCGRSREN